MAFFKEDLLGAPLHNADASAATRPVPLRHGPTVAETRALVQGVRGVAGYPPRHRTDRTAHAPSRMPLPEDPELVGSLANCPERPSCHRRYQSSRRHWGQT